MARITAVETEGQIEFEAEFGELTETRKEKIYKAMNDSVSYGYDLRSTKHRYFLWINFMKRILENNHQEHLWEHVFLILRKFSRLMRFLM